MMSVGQGCVDGLLAPDFVPRRNGGREHIVRARLSGLLFRLGTVPSPCAVAGSVAHYGAAQMQTDLGVGRLLGIFCPNDVAVAHDVWAEDWAQPVHHLVVAPRGAVVVGSCGPSLEERSPAVRAALGRARELRTWLHGTSWDCVPVYAAVCIVPEPSVLLAKAAVLGHPAPSWLSDAAVVMGCLWVGGAGRLPAWLAAGNALVADDRAALRSVLAGSLAGKSP